jgi:hypothetical protein
MSHAGMTRVQLDLLKQQMVDAERAYRTTVEGEQRKAIVRLRELKEEIEDKVREAEALADSVDLKFYYSSGYDEFTWSQAEHWNSSSQSC